MDMFREAFLYGGVWIYLVLAAGILGTVWLVGCAGYSAFKKELPAVLWWSAPVLVAIIALVGASQNAAVVLDLVENATPENQQQMLARGLFGATGTLSVGALINLWLGLLIAGGYAVASVFRADDEDKSQVSGPAIASAIALFAVIGYSMWITMSEVTQMAMLIPAALFIGSAWCAVAGIKVPQHAQSAGRVSMRYHAGGGMLWAVAAATIAAMCLSLDEIFRALEVTIPEDRAALFEAGFSAVEQTGYMGLGAFVVGVIILAIVVASGGGRAFDRKVATDATHGLGLVFVLLAALAYAYLSFQAFSPVFSDIMLGVSSG